ncbi:type II secretion system F family protein [Achromobacter seleniivolatilans]|uniref:Type II secretion system F family protein n=1 Tax=Achromobacter seleniivolatilans TaxID=3047478 RepID=A0ABY9MB39_9BURK|nr:type II secretion system F family protein [Achromobacter sp. R39]WMD23012.1 type II secretion system F family protein [Achromobacter sp. R39]
MIWLAVASTMCCAGVLAWRIQNWFAPALRRYREIYTQEAGVRLSELFLFIDPAQLWVAAVACAAGAAALAFSATGSGVVAAVIAAAASRVPRMMVDGLRARRARRFEQQLPMALLMLAAALRAGVALATGLRHVVEQSGAPLAQEFGLMLREQRLGVPWDTSLDNLHTRMPADSTSLVVAAMRIAAQTGGNLAEALESIAQTLRARLQLQAKLQALTSQGRLQAWIVGALPLLLLAVLDQLEPEIMGLLWRTPMGWGVLAIVAVLEIAGVLLIRRIIRIDI